MTDKRQRRSTNKRVAQPPTISTSSSAMIASPTAHASSPTASASASAAMDTVSMEIDPRPKRKRPSSSSNSNTSSSSASTGPPSHDHQTTTGSESNSIKTPTNEKRRARKKLKGNGDQPESNSNNQTTITTLSENAYPRGWSQLNIDFIESIAPFLPAREISYLHRTCHSWLHIADMIRTPHLCVPPKGCFRPSDEAVISHLLHSLIRRHVNTLELIEPVTPDELELIAHHLPKLQRLDLWRLPCTKISRWIFPPQLTELSVSFDPFEAASSRVTPTAISKSVNEILVGISHLANLTNLEFSMEEDDSDEDVSDGQVFEPSRLRINLQPLTRLVDSLTQLTLDIPLTLDPTLVLRSLVNLISLNPYGITEHQLAALLAEPVPFPQLEELDFGSHEFSNEDVPLLKRLTHLTKLGLPENEYLTDFSFLPHMVQLRRIEIKVVQAANERGDDDNDLGPDGAVDKLVESLLATSFQYLTSLVLSGPWDIDDKEFAQVFSRPMPVLKTLGLIKLRNIRSLAFMTRLSATLERLALVDCRSIQSAELLHLRFFPRLWDLDLTGTFDSRAREFSFTLVLIDPNSFAFQREWFPALTIFRWKQFSFG